MKNIQSFTFWKKPSFILALILGAFFLKGVFLAALSPIFMGQDESRHYNTIQYISEPRPITWEVSERKEPKEDTIQKYNYTQEIRETAKAIDYDNAIKGELYNTSYFEKGYEGKNELEIKEKKWNRYNEYLPINRAQITLYHKMAYFFEKILSDQDILVRYFLGRFFSVFLGTLTVLLSYFIAKNVGLSPKASLLLTAIVAFQPRFSIYYSSMNYDTLLILAFTAFSLGGVLALKKGLDWKNLLLMVFSIYLGISSKGTGYVLLAAFFLLLAFLFYKKIERSGKKIKYAAFSIFAIAAFFLFSHFKKYIPIRNNSPMEILVSLKEYLSESITMGRFGLSSRTYWGTLTWVESWMMDNLIDIIWAIEAFSAIGIILLLMPKKYYERFFEIIENLISKLRKKSAKYMAFFKNTRLDFLPEKKYILFLLGMIAALQIGIRAYDWKIFDSSGSLDLGTPGRYFLPNIAAHIILVFTGIGALLRKEKWFEKSLIVGLILMMMFCMYIIFDVIVYRYYL